MVKGLYPTDLKEAVIRKSQHPEAKLYAGGTDWMVRHAPCDSIIFLNQLEELKGIVKDEEFLKIGAGCSYVDLIKNPLIPEILKKAMRGIAAPAIRNIGTMGGNICNASPAGDTLPVLYALEAIAVLVSEEGERLLPVEKFILGVRKLAIKPNEILKEIRIPIKDFTHYYYEKVGARKSQALSKLSFVGMAEVIEGNIRDIRIAFGSVSATTVKIKNLEQKYTGFHVEEVKSLVNNILTDYGEYVTPIDDQRSTAEYRKEVSMRLLKDFILNL